MRPHYANELYQGMLPRDQGAAGLNLKWLLTSLGGEGQLSVSDFWGVLLEGF